MNQSVEFAEKIGESPDKNKVKLVLLKRAPGHSDPQFETDENLETVFSFLKRNIKWIPAAIQTRDANP